MVTGSYDADLKLFVNGAWRASEDRQPVLNPATGQAQAEVPLASAADLDEALATVSIRVAPFPSALKRTGASASRAPPAA